MPYLTYINTATTILGIDNGVANGGASIICYSTVNKITITMYLEKKGLLGLYWTTVTSWDRTFYASDAFFSASSSVSSGTYRIRAVYVAYSGSASESVTGYSPEVKYTA